MEVVKKAIPTPAAGLSSSGPELRGYAITSGLTLETVAERADVDRKAFGLACNGHAALTDEQLARVIEVVEKEKGTPTRCKARIKPKEKE